MHKIFEEIQARGYRLTKPREQVLEAVIHASRPVTAPEILETVNKNYSIDKATVYRNIEFLVKEHILREVHFNDDFVRYEYASEDHHHHIVCKICKKVIPVKSKKLENILDDFEKEIEKIHGIKVTSHDLEFFGECERCPRD